MEELLESERMRCEVWSRVMGYYRPKDAMNAGKQSEFNDRKFFSEAAIPPDPPKEA